MPPLPETPSQTAGPYVHIGLAPAAAGLASPLAQIGADPAGPNALGTRIRIEGTVLDGAGTPVRDALIETWQANAAGIHPHPADPRAGEVEPGFRGFARLVPDFETGRFVLETVKPGRVPFHGPGGPGGRLMAPHITLLIHARGINVPLQTRLCFADEAEANDACPVLGLIEQPSRRATLLAEAIHPGHYRFDIRLQGDGETVFFDI